MEPMVPRWAASAPAANRNATFTTADLRALAALSKKLAGMGIRHERVIRRRDDGAVCAVYLAGPGYRLLSITKHPGRPGFDLAGDGAHETLIGDLRDILQERISPA